MSWDSGNTTSWDSGKVDFSSGAVNWDNPTQDTSHKTDFGGGFDASTHDFNGDGFSSNVAQTDFSGGNDGFSSNVAQTDFSGGAPRVSVPRTEEEIAKYRGYEWASNRERYEFNENNLDESGLAPRDEALEEKLFGEAKESQDGLDFARYAMIPVSVERGEAPQRIVSFDAAGLHPVMNINIKLAHYLTPTPVQTLSIPIVTSGKDLMACAQTGSGKTAAFLMPTLSSIFYKANELKQPKPAAYEMRGFKAEPIMVIIAPTRELCSQIFDDCRRFTYRSPIRPCAIYGGADPRGQLTQIERGCDVLVASPGRLIDFIQRGKIGLERVKFLVLDEADRMLDMGFEAVIRAIIQKNGMNKDRQTLLFSATFPRTIRALARDFLRPDYLFLKVGRVGGIPNSITQKFMQVEEEDKRRVVKELLELHPPTRTLIFVETKRSADSLDQYLYENSFPSTSIHGDRTQMEREDAILAFKNGKCPILVATAVAARGIDVKNVMHVINYDMPKDMDEYTHRIGRTARQGKTGLATNFWNSGSDNIATELVKILKECCQKIPDFLKHYETEDVTFDEDLDDTGVEMPSYAGQEYIEPEKYVPPTKEQEWNCPECSQSNFASRFECFKCHAAKPTSGDAGGDSYGGSGGGGRPGDWNCPECSQSNFASRSECFKCHAAKPEGGDSYSGGGGRPGDWNCPDCSQSNFASRFECFKCHAAKPEGGDSYSGGGGRPGDWSCPDCSQSNFASRGECFKCGAGRPEHLGRPARREPRPQRDGDWGCSSCSAVNYGNRTNCFKCHASKEGDDTTVDTVTASWNANDAAAGWSGTTETSTKNDWNAPGGWTEPKQSPTPQMSETFETKQQPTAGGWGSSDTAIQSNNNTGW